ncbi:MAG: MspA family protein [Mycobacterium sp.]|nr:MspA family protein [Mycobacterium sp.]
MTTHDAGYRSRKSEQSGPAGGAMGLRLRRSTRRRRRSYVASGMALLVGLLATVESPSAHAEPVDMAPQHYSKATRDGWNLNISIEGERINSVPNLAAAANSREAFVTLSATATATGGTAPITDSAFITGYQLGCQTDVSNGLQTGIGGAFGPSASLGAPIANPMGAAGNFGIAGGVSGFIQGIIQPGVIVEVPMSNMALSGDGRAMLDIDNIHIKADACGGDVTIRSYAYLRISSADAHSQFAIYGDPIKI